jgi:hypothetical protein
MNSIVISPYQSPFSDLTSSELLEELWEEGIDWQFKPHFSWFKKSGGPSFVVSVLMMLFSEIVYRKPCQELCAFKPQDSDEIDTTKSRMELGSAVGHPSCRAHYLSMILSSLVLRCTDCLSDI